MLVPWQSSIEQREACCDRGSDDQLFLEGNQVGPAVGPAILEIKVSEVFPGGDDIAVHGQNIAGIAVFLLEDRASLLQRKPFCLAHIAPVGPLFTEAAMQRYRCCAAYRDIRGGNAPLFKPGAGL